MKKAILSLLGMAVTMVASSQKYPEPEFTNEVYYLSKDTGYTVVRLEKNNSKLETKTKAGGLGGSESGYSFDGEKSTVQFHGGSHLSFVFSTGKSSSSTGHSAQGDSMMKANGIDPAMMEGMQGMMDPISRVSLYKVESGKKKRVILIQKNSGAMPFASKKAKSSDKISFSVKKIREGYWELVIDKPLEKGEYAFTSMDMMAMSGNGSINIFAFSIQ